MINVQLFVIIANVKSEDIKKNPIHFESIFGMALNNSIHFFFY